MVKEELLIKDINLKCYISILQNSEFMKNFEEIEELGDFHCILDRIING